MKPTWTRAQRKSAERWIVGEMDHGREMNPGGTHAVPRVSFPCMSHKPVSTHVFLGAMSLDCVFSHCSQIPERVMPLVSWKTERVWVMEAPQCSVFRCAY